MVKTLVVLSIDPEFKSICPTQTESEQALLRESIIAEGCREAIYFWENAPEGGNPIVDGMSRHEICQGEGIQFESKGLIFADRREVRLWIRRNQLGRRNLTDAQRTLIIGAYYNELKTPQGGDHKSTGQSGRLIDAAQEAAAEFGVGERTARRAGTIAEAADAIVAMSPELKEPIEQGTIPLSAVPKLANATRGTLNRLATKAKNPKALRQAVKKASSANRTSGKPVNRAKWKDLEDLLGKALLKADDLNKVEPHSNLHRMVIADIKQAMNHLDQWKGSKVA